MDSNIEENVIALFREKGFERHQQLTQQIARRVFNQHSQFITSRPFKTQMMTEILNHCRYGKLQITPKGLGQVVSEAYHILLTRLNQLQGEYGLIKKQKQLLSMCQKRSVQISQVKQPHNIQKQQLFGLQKDIQNIKNQLKELQTSEITFIQECQIIDKLFRKYIPTARLKKMNKNNQPIQLNPNLLTYMFYLSIIGLFVQCAAVQARPGWIAIVVYLQSLFLLLVGYFNKKAVMCLTFSGIVSVILDILGIVLLQLFEYQYTLFMINDDPLTKLLNIVHKAAFIISIILRCGIIITCYPYMQPPLKKINFDIFGTSLILNTRMKKIGSTNQSQVIYSP